MDLASIVGLSFSIIVVAWGMIMGGDIMAFYDLPSILIVLGGTLGAAMVANPLDRTKILPKILKNAFVSEQIDMIGLIQTLVSFAEKARREGLLALEEDAGQLDDEFMRKSIQLVVDGTDPELVKSILDTEIGLLEERHSENKGYLDSIAELGPAFGMLGTLIGLIQMLGNLDDPSALGPGMAVALVTTFYGSVLANMVAIPIGKKLNQNSGREILCRELMVEGILSIQAGENPRIVEEKLKVFLPPKMRKVLDEGKEEE
ncbi:MAG: motility protein A [Synergistaceae bacterium]|jgi:chemotaxis protein MotA|nr:motility protein A [Synergistaceae bacterium]